MTAATDIKALQARIAELEAMVAAQAGQEPVGFMDKQQFKQLMQHKDRPNVLLNICTKGTVVDPVKLYAAPPAPASLSLVRAALEAAAKECETAEVPIDAELWLHGTKKGLSAATAIGLAAIIRAIDPQTIISEASK